MKKTKRSQALEARCERYVGLIDQKDEALRLVSDVKATGTDAGAYARGVARQALGGD